MTQIAGREVGTNDLVMMGAGALMLIDGFLPWYGVNFAGITSINVKGFSSGFLAWLSILLVIAVAGVVAARIFAGRALPTSGPVGPALALLAASGLATVLIVLRLLTQSSYTKFGLFLGLILAAVQAAFAYLSFRASGEPLPDFVKRGSTGGGRGTTPPPAGGAYPPPPPAGGGFPPPPPPPGT